MYELFRHDAIKLASEQDLVSSKICHVGNHFYSSLLFSIQVRVLLQLDGKQLDYKQSQVVSCPIT